MKISIAVAATVAALIALGAFVSGSAQAASSCIYSARGCVHVQGYYKPSTGTYVRPYVRNYPSYRPYTYRPSRSYRYGF